MLAVAVRGYIGQATRAGCWNEQNGPVAFKNASMLFETKRLMVNKGSCHVEKRSLPINKASRDVEADLQLWLKIG
jgi:hypothetical protein